MTTFRLRLTALPLLLLSTACDTSVEPRYDDDSIPVGAVSRDGEDPEPELECTIDPSHDSGLLDSYPQSVMLGVQEVQGAEGETLLLDMDPGNTPDQCREWFLQTGFESDPAFYLDELSDGEYRAIHDGNVAPGSNMNLDVELWVNAGSGGPQVTDAVRIAVVGGVLMDPVFLQITPVCPALWVGPGESDGGQILTTGGDDPISYEKQAGSPSWITVGSGGWVSASPGSDVAPDYYVYSVLGTDPSGETGTCDGTVQVLGMTITAPTIFATPGDSESGDAQHSNGTEPVHYRLVSGPDWIAVHSNGTVWVTPDESVEYGVYGYTIEATDSSNPEQTAQAVGYVWVEE